MFQVFSSFARDNHRSPTPTLPTHLSGERARATPGDDAAFPGYGGWTTPDKQRELLEACGEGLRPELRERATLARFLIARKGSVDDAAKMLLRHQQWRLDECP